MLHMIKASMLQSRHHHRFLFEHFQLFVGFIFGLTARARANFERDLELIDEFLKF